MPLQEPTLRVTNDPCPIGPVGELIFGRWTSHVLWVLGHEGRLRFGDVQRRLPGVTPKVLTSRLRQLERDGLVSRHYHPEVPPRVEYELTELAESIIPVLRTLVAWSDEHLPAVQSARARAGEGT